MFSPLPVEMARLPSNLVLIAFVAIYMVKYGTPAHLSTIYTVKYLVLIAFVAILTVKYVAFYSSDATYMVKYVVFYSFFLNFMFASSFVFLQNIRVLPYESLREASISAAWCSALQNTRFLLCSTHPFFAQAVSEARIAAEGCVFSLVDVCFLVFLTLFVVLPRTWDSLG